MPEFRNRVAVDLLRNLTALLEIRLGLYRGNKAGKTRDASHLESQLREAREEISRLRAGGDGVADGRIDPSNVVWIFGTARVGSTWLGKMLGDLPGYSSWREPMVGDLFGDLYYRRSRGRKRMFILGGDKPLWMPAIRAFLLEAIRLKYPETGGSSYLAVQEPNGSVGAPLLSEALPESRLILLVRDPRDVVASSLDANREGSWYRHGDGATAGQEPDELVERLANKYAESIGNAKLAYENHAGPKTLVRYEELRTDTPSAMRRILDELHLPAGTGELKSVVERHAFEAIPQEDRGEGKFYRKANPGSWREDLTPQQVTIVEGITGDLLKAFYG